MIDARRHRGPPRAGFFAPGWLSAAKLFRLLYSGTLNYWIAEVQNTLTDSLEKAAAATAEWRARNPRSPLDDGSVFSGACALIAARVGRETKADIPPPNWLEPTLKALEGQHVTASEVLAAGGIKQHRNADAKWIGAQLRAMGKPVRKSNGKLVFTI